MKSPGLISLSIAAWAVTGCLIAKAWIDIDPGWDSWHYHLPYAGRLWEIIPESSYRMGATLEGFYLTMPKLAEWAQGGLWWMTGRVQAANLVSLASLLLFVYFLYRRFHLPYAVSMLSLLAVPLVHIHATSDYVDLPANLAMAALVLLVWEFYSRASCDGRYDVWPILLAACIAAHTKFFLLPAVFLCLLLASGRLIWLTPYEKRPVSIALLALAGIVIFAIPIKNYLLFGNPIYPAQLQVAGLSLPHTMVFYPAFPAWLEHHSPFIRWLASLLELKRPFATWNIDQLPASLDVTDRLGGFFNLYVLLQLCLLLFLVRKSGRRGTYAAIAVMMMSLVCAYSPQGHELRYYLYWMIVLVSFNLILLQQLPSLHEVVWSANALFFGTVVWLTGAFYLLPQGIDVARAPLFIHKASPFPFVPEKLSLAKIEAIEDGGMLCLTNQHPLTYLYASYFHPSKRYSVFAAERQSDCPAAN